MLDQGMCRPFNTPDIAFDAEKRTWTYLVRGAPRPDPHACLLS